MLIKTLHLCTKYKFFCRGKKERVDVNDEEWKTSRRYEMKFMRILVYNAEKEMQETVRGEKKLVTT